MAPSWRCARARSRCSTLATFLRVLLSAVFKRIVFFAFHAATRAASESASAWRFRNSIGGFSSVSSRALTFNTGVRDLPTIQYEFNTGFNSFLRRRPHLDRSQAFAELRRHRTPRVCVRFQLLQRLAALHRGHQPERLRAQLRRPVRRLNSRRRTSLGSRRSEPPQHVFHRAHFFDPAQPTLREQCTMSDIFAATDSPLPVLIPRKLGLGSNKTSQQLVFNLTLYKTLIMNNKILELTIRVCLYSEPVS
jgi:hypothetical protein